MYSLRELFFLSTTSYIKYDTGRGRGYRLIRTNDGFFDIICCLKAISLFCSKNFVDNVYSRIQVKLIYVYYLIILMVAIVQVVATDYI